jgi:hypothetical protein
MMARVIRMPARRRFEYVPGRVVATTLALAVLALASGCGSDEPQSAAQPSPAGVSETPSASGSGAATDEDAGAPGSTLMQLKVRVLRQGRSSTGAFVEHAVAEPGDTVQLLVTVRNAAPRAQVAVRLPKTPGRSLRIDASVVGGEPDVGATLEAADGRMGLAALRFTCVVRARSFCPAVKAEEGREAFEVVLDARRAQLGGPVVLASTVVDSDGS